MRIIKQSNHLIVEDLLKIANRSEVEKTSYLLSYPYFIDYFKNLQVITLENLIIGISFSYAWMPTILKSINLQSSDEILLILNQVKSGNKINKKQLSLLKSTFNNSLVGTSKLLHFINPEQYAIWDSRVFRFLTEEQPHKYKLENIDTYLKYHNFIENLKAEETLVSFYELMNRKVGYPISKYRALELAFFLGKTL